MKKSIQIVAEKDAFRLLTSAGRDALYLRDFSPAQKRILSQLLDDIEREIS